MKSARAPALSHSLAVARPRSASRPISDKAHREASMRWAYPRHIHVTDLQLTFRAGMTISSSSSRELIHDNVSVCVDSYGLVTPCAS